MSSPESKWFEGEHVFHNIVEQATDLIYLLDLDLRIVWLNRHSVNVFTHLLTPEFASKIPSEATEQPGTDLFIGKRLGELFRPGDVAFLRKKVIKVLQTQESISYEHIATVEDGQLHFSTKLIPIRNDENQLHQILGITRDMTETRRVDQRIYNAEKLASLGILAAGVAHEINNPLAIILGFTDLLLEQFSPDSSEHKDLKRIEYNANLAQKVVEQMLGFARVTEGMQDTLEVRSSLDTVVNVISPMLKTRKVELVMEVPLELPRVQGDPREVQQVIFNLINNAVAAMERAPGILTIAVRSTERWVHVEVGDTGEGIPERHRPKVFDPFFTTKKVGEGTGLGLSLCYGIVSKFGGRIQFETSSAEDSPGQPSGTVFTVSLPVVKAPHLE